MGNEYYGFCNKINEAAVNGRVVNITIETEGLMCSGMYSVEPIRENEENFEIKAGELELIFDKSDELLVEFDGEFESYIISNNIYRCEFQ